MKTEIAVQLIGLELPSKVTATLNWPRSPRSIPMPSQPPPPMQSPPTSAPLKPQIVFDIGQLTPEQVEWLIDDFAFRLRAKANVPCPDPLKEEPAPDIRLQEVVDLLVHGVNSRDVSRLSASHIVTYIKANT